MSFADSLNEVYLNSNAISSNGNEIESNSLQASKRMKVEPQIHSNIQSNYFELGPNASNLPRHGMMLIRGFVVYIYNPFDGKNEWIRVNDCKRDRSYFEAVIFKNEIYCISTFNLVATGTIEKFNFSKNKWLTVAPLPQKIRSVASVAMIDPEKKEETLIVIGGIDLTTNAASKYVYVFHDEINQETEAQNISSTDELDTNESTATQWSIQGELLCSRYRHTAAVYDGKVWIVGGIIEAPTDKELQYTATVEIYDPTTGKSVHGPLLRQCRAIDVSLRVVMGELYVIGGDVTRKVESVTGDKESVPIYSIDKYDATRKVWIPVTQFPVQRRGFAATSVGSKIYIFGGSNHDEDSNTFDTFDVTTLKWEVDSEKSNQKIPDECEPFVYGQAICY